ncbi:MAG: hypothetical protein ACOCM8_07480 [Acetivibrio ethanolgignens]
MSFVKGFVNLIKVILFLCAGAGLLFVPYERLKSWFPRVPKPVVIKILGVIVLLCGFAILALQMM